MQVTNNACLSECRIKLITWVLLLVMPIVGMAVDLIAPSLPAMASSLGVEKHAVQNAISIYLLGYALGNFVTGFLSDAWGRQKLLRIGLLSFSIVSLLPVIYPTISVLLATRILQGFTIGGVVVITRAIFSDIMPSEKLTRLGTVFATMWGLGPVIGPVLGGYLQHYIGWKAGFCFFSIATLLLCIVGWAIVPETLSKKQPLIIKQIIPNIKEVLSNRCFMAFTIIMGLSYSLIISFNTMGPFLVQGLWGHSAVFFGRFALMLGLVFLVSTFVVRRLVRNVTISKLFIATIHVGLFVAVAACALSFFAGQNIILTALISGAMFFVAGILYPSSMGRSMTLFRHIAGTAAALLYLINIAICSLSSMIVSFIDIQSSQPLMVVYLILLVGCTLTYWKFINKEVKDNKS